MGLEGKTLQGRYLIERQVGLGGMGAVYIASDQRFNSTVAIKQTLCMDDNYRMAIERGHLQPLPEATLARVAPARPRARVLPFPSIQHPLSVYGDLMEALA